MCTEIISELKTNLTKLIDFYTEELASKNPNKIDLNKVKSMLINNKQLKTYEHSDIMIYPQGVKSVRIDIIKGSTIKIAAITKAALDIGYSAVEKDDGVYISLYQLTTEDRNNLAKEVKIRKENIKQKINAHRSSAVELAKKLPKSDKEKLEKEIDKIKDEFYAKLEKLMNQKIDEIMK